MMRIMRTLHVYIQRCLLRLSGVVVVMVGGGGWGVVRSRRGWGRGYKDSRYTLNMLLISTELDLLESRAVMTVVNKTDVMTQNTTQAPLSGEPILKLVWYCH